MFNLKTASAIPLYTFCRKIYSVKMNRRLFFFVFIFAIVISTGCNAADNCFSRCIFDKKADLIVLTNKSGNYKLSIWLYGTQIESGEYQVFGSEKETLLEAELLQDGTTRDAKTTLFINCRGKKIKVSGSAQLYKPNSIRKSGEVLDFTYDGKLTVIQ